jgi:hypothetical protein
MDESANPNIYSHTMVRFETQKGARDTETEHVSIAIRPFSVANLVYARSDNEANTIFHVAIISLWPAG